MVGEYNIDVESGTFLKYQFIYFWKIFLEEINIYRGSWLLLVFEF